MDLDDPKLKLHEYLKEEIEKEIGNPDIRLDAFVISVTAFKDLARIHGPQFSVDRFEKEKHVLFQSTSAGIHSKSYIEKMFEIINAQ